MTSKPNWACVKCGMFSSRRGSVKRHVSKLHGSGPVIRFVDYVAGRQAGHYPPASIPAFVKAESHVVDETKLDQRAFRQGYWNEAGKEAFRQKDPTMAMAFNIGLIS